MADLVDSDDKYFRHDDDKIQDVLRSKSAVRVIYGLRRFGKTCFLKRLERHAPQYGYKPVFIACQGIQESAVNEVAIDIKSDEGKHLVLLDDIIMLTRFDDTEIDSIVRALNKLALAVEAAGERAKIVLSEPTCLPDWLNDSIPGFKHGKLICSAMSSKSGVSYLGAPPNEDRYWLRAFTDEEALHLLWGAKQISGTQLDFVDLQCAHLLNRNLGGNPWLLNAARELLRVDMVWPSDLDGFALRVAKHAQGLPGGETAFRSIVGSLCHEEKFVVQLLYEANKKQNSDKQAQALTGNSGAAHWRRSAWQYINRLSAMGVINAIDNSPYNIRGSALMEAAAPLSGESWPLFLEPGPADLELWASLLLKPHPMAGARPRSVVHQFEDLFFDASDKFLHESWDRYFNYLKDLKDTFDSKAGDAKASVRPSLVVISGNIVAGATSKKQYAKNLKFAFQEVSKIVPFLEPLPGREKADNSQIVIVPGLFDLWWAQHGGAPDPYVEWTQLCEEHEFTTSPRIFRELGIHVIPIDTLQLSGAERAFGSKAKKELIENRAALQEKFGGSWDPESGIKKAHRADAARFLLRYAALNDKESDQDNSELSPHDESPTFRSLMTRRTDNKTESFLVRTESGFLSEDDEHIFNSLDPLPVKTDRERVLRIAVMHHCPMQRNPLSVTEFHRNYHFRQKLALKGVNLLMHGHSSGLQCVSEKVRSSSFRGESVVNMIGSGGFAAKRGFLVETLDYDAEPLEVIPSFNVLTITPPSSDSAPYSVSISSLRMPSDSPKTLKHWVDWEIFGHQQ